MSTHFKRSKFRLTRDKRVVDSYAVDPSVNNDTASQTTSPLMALACAALALPGFGVLCTAAHAENAPENGLIAFKYLRYEDSQPGLKRIVVNAPSISLMAPIAGSWSIEAGGVLDSLSGPSPKAYSSLSSASKMSDYRKAGDVKLTKYFPRSAISVGYSTGKENDYAAQGMSIDGRWSSEDNNTTFNAGYAHDNDKVRGPNPEIRGGLEVVKGTKVTDQMIVGLTQVLTKNDLAQVNLSFSNGRSRDMEVGNSAFNDPYKLKDIRPETRSSAVILARWNHHVESLGASLKWSYRYYRDSFKVSSSTFGVDWVQPVGAALTLTPSLRYFSQNAADFFVDPVAVGGPSSTTNSYGVPDCYYVNLCGKQYGSVDQRLAAFGAITAGLKLSYKVTKEWTIDGKVELYEQKSNWRLGGKGSPGIDTFNANFYQVGISRSF